MKDFVLLQNKLRNQSGAYCTFLCTQKYDKQANENVVTIVIFLLEQENYFETIGIKLQHFNIQHLYIYI